MDVGYIVLVVATAILIPVPLFIALFRDIRHKWLVFVTAPFGIMPIIGYHTEEWWVHLLTFPWLIALIWSTISPPSEEASPQEIPQDPPNTPIDGKEIRAFIQLIQELSKRIKAVEDQMMANEQEMENDEFDLIINEAISQVISPLNNLVMQQHARIKELEDEIDKNDPQEVLPKEWEEELEAKNNEIYGLQETVKELRNDMAGIEKENQELLKLQDQLKEFQDKVEFLQEEIQRKNNETGRKCEQEIYDMIKDSSSFVWRNSTPIGFPGDIDIVLILDKLKGIAVIECKAGALRVEVDDSGQGVVANADGNPPNRNHIHCFRQVARQVDFIQNYCDVDVMPIVCIWGQTSPPFSFLYRDEQDKAFDITICSMEDLPNELSKVSPSDIDIGSLTDLLGKPHQEIDD